METSTLIRAITERMGDHDEARVRRSARAVVEAIAERLPAPDLAAIADELPSAWLNVPTDTRPLLAGVDPVDEVALRAGLTDAGAREYLVVVAQVIAEQISPDARARLERHLPPPWPTLLAPPRRAPAATSPPHHAPATGERHTIANSRPGSLEPLAEAAGEPAQPGSIARSDDPHHDSKLSSGSPHTGRHGV